MTNWTEVNVYTGRPVDEDAPTNFAGTGSGVDMNPTGMRKKKKKLVDARTKSYKTHRAKLEAARIKREAKRNGVQEEVELDEAILKGRDYEYDEKEGVIKISKKNFAKVKKDSKGTDKSKPTMMALTKQGTALVPVRFTEEVELDEAKKIEIVFEPRTIKNQMPKVVDFFKKNHPKFKLTQNMSDDSLTVDGGGKSLARIGKDIFNNYHIKKVVHEEVERKTFSQKVVESVSNFNVESLLAEDNVDVLRSIVKRKSAKPIKFKDGTMTIDMQTANMMLTVLDKVKPANQKKLAAMMNGKKSEFMKVHGFVMKALGK